MPYPTRGSLISLDQANTLIRAFRASTAHYNGVDGGFYGREMIQTLLNNPACDGLRYYHGLGPDSFDGNKIKQTIVIVGEDTGGNCLTSAIVELGTLCPPFCPSGVSLGT